VGKRVGKPCTTDEVPTRAEERRRRQQLSTEIRDALRELGIQLALLNHQVGARLELKDVDLDCFKLIDRHGPVSPSASHDAPGCTPPR
jgi:hypothetical protein